MSERLNHGNFWRFRRLKHRRLNDGFAASFTPEPLCPVFPGCRRAAGPAVCRPVNLHPPRHLEANSAPATPSSVSLTRADGTVTADWPADSAATKWHVTYSTDGGGSWHAPVDDHTNVTTNTLTFNADNAKSYTVGVRAGNDHGWSGWRNSPQAGPYTPPQPTPTPTPRPDPTPTPTPQPSNPPSTPSSVSLSRADGTVTADWPAVSDATRYHVTYSDDGGSSWHAPVNGHTNIATNTLTFNAKNSKSYIVGVRAGNDHGWSGWRNSASIAPLPQPTPTPTPEPEPTATPTPAPEPTATPTPEPEPTATPAPTSTPEPEPTATPTPQPAEPPDTPSSVTVTRSDGTITASWPAVTGASGYTVTYSAVGNGNWTTAAANQARTSITISGVNNNYTYVVGASANNGAGSSNRKVSPPSGPYSQRDPLAPPSVTILRADKELTAFWNSGFGAESYHVTYTDDNGKTWKLAASGLAVGNGTTEITIKNLKNSKHYTVGVRARNKNGYSGWRNSAPSGPYVPIVAPPKPRNVKGYLSDGAVTFIWDKPVDLGDAEVTGYQAAYWLNPGNCDWPNQDEATAKWYNIYGSNSNTVYHTVVGHHTDNGVVKPGLKNGVRYGVALRALNQDVPGPGFRGCGKPVAGVSPPPFVPPAPENLNVIRGDGTLTVTWHHSWSATGYQVDYSTNGGQSWAMAVWWNNTTSTILRGMDNNTSYTVRVRGRNSRGDGPWSELKPTTSSITDKEATFSIGGYSGTWYYQQVDLSGDWNGCHQAPANSNSVNLTGLTPGTQYVYYAHLASDCEDIRFLVTSFKTRASSGKSFSFTNVTHSTMDATLHGHTGEWWFEVTRGSNNDEWASCRKSSSKTSFWAMRANTTHTITAYSDSACTTQVASDSVKTLRVGWLTYADLEQTTVDLRLDFHAGDWWYQADTGPHTTCAKAGGSTITVTGLTANTDYRYRAYSDSSCTTRLDSLSFTTFSSRDSSKDFDTLTAAGNTGPDGIWSDGTTMWVSDWGDDKAFAYTLATKARDSGKDISFHNNNDNPSALTSDGTTMWSADLDQGANDKLFAYSVSGKSRDASKDITLHANNRGTYALWANSATIWVGDRSDTYIYAYTISGGARDTTKEFALHADNDDVNGLWSDGTTMWVSDRNDDKLYAYKLSDGSRDSAKDYTLHSDNDKPDGIWSNGTTMWVLDTDDDKIYAYNSIQ